MADDKGYEVLTYQTFETADEIARRNLARLRYEDERRKEAEKRRKQLLEEAQRQALEKQQRDLIRGGSLPPEMQPGPGFIPSLSDPTMPRTVAPNAKSVNIDGVQKPIDEALADIPKQMTLEEQILSSPLKARALRRARVEELMRNGRNFQEAEAEAIKEQEKRQTAFDEGRKSIQKETNNPDKEARGFAESIATSVGGPVARIAGYEQAADEIEARNAGIQAELNQYRDENYAYPRVAGAVAGAAQNTAQMGVGVSASILAGPEVGMAVMAGQYGAQEYSRAAYEGKQAGLAGNELHRYALVQGGIEASIMPIMSKIGLGGIESRVLRQSIARGVASHPSMRAALANGAKTLARDTAAEITEEVITEVLHGYATEKLTNQNVDYRRVIEDTVLQTVMMMGMGEATSQIGGSLGGGGTPASPQVPVNQPAPDVAEEPPVQDLALPPEVEAFLANPSRKKYEAAVKAGMPPGSDTKTIEGRARYAEELRQARDMEAAMQQEQNQPAAEQTPEEPSGTVPDEDVDMMARMLEEGVPDETVQGQQQGEQVQQQGQQGGQEGLLEQPSTIDGAEAAAVPNDSVPPAATPEMSWQERLYQENIDKAKALTKEEFRTKYLDTYKRMISYPPDQAGSNILSDEMAAMFDAQPEWADEIEAELPIVDTQTAPAFASGDPSQGQPEPSLAGPASDTDRQSFEKEYLDIRSKLMEITPNEPVKWEFSTKPEAQPLLKRFQELQVSNPDWADEVETAFPSIDAISKPSAPTDQGDEQSEPELPEGAIGFNSEGIPIFEGKTGLRSIGTDIEQAKSLKKTKDGMKAVLPGPREDRFKTREELEQEKGSSATDSPSPEFLALPQKSQDLFNKAMESKDIPSLKQMVDKSNRVWNKEFERRTGIKLPKTLKDRYQAVIDWAGTSENQEAPAVSGKRSEIEKWEVYPTLFQGKPKFAVKEFDSGFGDAMFDSEAEAKEYADTGRQRAAEKSEREAKAQAKQEEDQKKQQEHEASFQGFLTDDPMTKGRRLKTLDSSLNYKNKPTTRKALIEQKVADGWTVNSQGQLQAPTGEFLDERDLTKTGIDYAQHLVNIGREAEKPSEATTAEPTVEFTEMSKGVNAPGVLRTVRVTAGPRTLVMELNKKSYAWSIRESTAHTGKGKGKTPAKGKELAFGMIDLGKAKDVARRIIAGTFDSNADLVFQRSDTENIGYTNSEFGKEIKSEKNKDKFARVLREENIATDGKVMIKVKDKDRDSILKAVGPTDEQAPLMRSPAQMFVSMDEAIKAGNTKALEIVGFRGGDITTRTIALKSDDGEITVVSKAYYDTVTRMYPKAVPILDGEKVVFTDNENAIAMLMPMDIRESDAHLELMKKGNYPFRGDPEEAAPAKTPAESQAEKTEEPRKGIVGDMLASGEIVKTSSGRVTTPFPQIALNTSRKLAMTLRKAEEWLRDNALAEAESRGDEFNAIQFRNETPGKMPKATKDAMEEYLFGEQPEVVPSVLKPLVTPSEKPVESSVAYPDKAPVNEDYWGSKSSRVMEWTKAVNPVSAMKPKEYAAVYRDGKRVAAGLVQMTLKNAVDIESYGKTQRFWYGRDGNSFAVGIPKQRDMVKPAPPVETPAIDRVTEIETEAASIADAQAQIKSESMKGSLKPATEAEKSAEPHTLTYERYVMKVRATEGRFDMDNVSKAIHRSWVEEAIKSGKTVPAEVLAEYPDLRPAPVEKQQEIKPKAEPSQEDLMEQMLREEVLGETSKPQKERKPRTPKSETAEPKTPRKPRTEAAKKRKEKTAAELKAAEEAVRKAFGSTANMGLNKDQMRATARLVKAALDHGVSTFNEFVAYVVDTFGEPMALQMAEGIELAWRTLKRLPEYSGIDDAGTVAGVLSSKEKPQEQTGWSAVPGHFAEQLISGKDYKSITEARKEAGEIVGQPIRPGTADAKTLDEAIEHGIVQAGRTIVEEGGTAVETFDKLVDMYARQPVLGVRDTTSMEMQAYSTPVPLAFLASHLGNVGKDTKVYEPTAGNGMLLIGTSIENAFANELDPDRAEILRAQGFEVTTEDAVSKTPPKVQVVLANPPFGKVKDADRKTVEFNVDGFKTTEVDHAIALQALKGMEPDGHAVLILAAKGHNAKTDLERRQAYSQGKDRPFYDALYQGYDVVQHFTVDGSLYSRQGASFPVDVIVLRPQGTVSADQKRAAPWARMPRKFNDWGEIRNAFFSDMADTGAGTGVRTGASDNGGADLSAGNADDMGRVPGQNENATPMVEGDVRPAESESVVSTPVDGISGSGRGSKKPRGSRTQSGISGNAGIPRGGEGNVSNASSQPEEGTGGNAGTRPDGMAGTGTAEPGEVDQESHQSSYQPSSKNKTVETLIPTNLQDATRKALEAVEDAHGSIDEFVQKELGYSKNDPFFKDMSAEQVDAIALAIHAHQKGSGMVIGDMTGVGKGRVAAAMMRYANRQGLTPLFVTQTADLYADMYRDLGDIGSDTADLPFVVIATNDTSGSDYIQLPNGRKIQSSLEANMAMLREGISSLADGKGFVVTIDGKPMKVNAVFTMYSQLQTVKGNETERREQLRALIPNAYLIMDESHNAGGTKKERVNENAPPDRAAYAREIVQGAKGVMYLSATFAKRPDVMDLYSKTDMAKAVEGDITRLGSVVKAGGLPLQQVLSAMLAESGQYIRREKSFEGIEFAKVDVGVDLEQQDKITEVFRTIRDLDSVVAEIVSSMQDDMVAAGESGFAGDAATGDAGLVSTNFSSMLWNAVEQMLFSLKADKAADEAIAAWKRGEVPIIAVDGTLEKGLNEYVENNNLKAGDVVNLTFKDVLHRYLERSRWMTVDTGQRDARGKKITRKERLTDDNLNFETDKGNALELFRLAYQMIENTAIDAPASPIDWIRYRMQKAGMKISEVTGRKSILVYSDSGVATLAARPRSESGTRGKQETIRKINDGSLDGLILNRSGATGLSIHASAKVKNQKVRHMMIAQPAKNIDEFMQMLGRVNRTGQVVPPRYSLLMSDSPAELRPAAVLSKKLASLNASVTAKSKGAVGFTVTDVMNEVGGAIVERYLIENPEFARWLDMEREDEEVDEDASRAEALEEIVRKATGRSAILPIVQQREFWEDITAAYNARIEELNALNANPLIAQTMDLDAKTLTSINVFAGTPDEGPFAAPADLERVDIKSPGKPMSPSQVTGRIQEFYEISDINDRFAAQSKWLVKTTESLEAEIGPYREFALSRTVTEEARRGREEMISRQTDSVMEAMSKFTPGTVVRYMVDGMPFDGVVIGFSRRGKTGNPVAPSRWVIEVAINDAAKKLNIPVSQAQNLFTLARAMDQVLSDFERAQTVSRQKRWMGTGNLVAAYAQLSEMNGKLVFYTDDQGQTRRGILMPQSFDANRFLEQRPVQFTDPTEMLRYFDQGGSRLVTADGVLQIVMRNGTLSFVAPRARSRGGKYTLNRSITTAAGRDFITVGNQMSLGVNNRQQQLDTLAAVLAISPLEARLESDREVARDVLNLTKTGQKKYEDDSQETGETTVSEAEPAETAVTPNQAALEKARKELEAQQLLNRQYWQAIVKEWQKVTRGETPATGLPITKEMARNIANALMGQIRAGAKSFEIAIREIRDGVSEEILRDLKQNLIPTWNYFAPKFDLMPATEEAFEAALDATKDQDIEQAAEAAMGAQPATETTPAESQPDEGRLYSTKNAATDMERERFGMEPRVPLPRQSRPEQAETAAAIGKTEAGRRRIDELIAEMSVSPRATSVLENDLLNFRYAELDQKREAALKAKMEARAKDDDAQVAVQDLIASDLLTQQMQLIELLSTTISYALGSGLQARKAWINTDYSMARMMLEYEAAYGERPSKPQQEAMQKLIDELTAAKEALEKKQQELQAENDDLQKRLKEAHDEKTTEASKPAETPPATAPTETVVEGLKERGRKRVNAAKKVIADLLKQGFTFSIEGAVNEAGKALTELAIGYTEMGIATAADFLKQLKRDFGPSSEKIKVPALAAFNEVIKSSASAELDVITSRLDITDPDTIGRVARDLHSFVIRRDGLNASKAGREAAVDAVHEILAAFVPGITGDEVARAMSGIGVYSELSKDEAEVVRRDQKAQLLLLEQIADWKKKQAPPVTGPERPPVSDEQRALRRLVNEAKKEAGIVESKAGQLRSAMDAAKRMATNRIKDLTKAIEDNKRIAGKQKVLQDDGSPEFAELKALQAQRDALQKLYDETFGRPELSDEQRLARAEKALDRAIADLEADLNAGKLYNDNTRAPLSSPALEAKRAHLEALKASREEMRLQSGEAQARSDAAYERHLRERDARLAQRIADNDFAPRPKKPERILTPEATKLMLAVKKKQQEINQKARQWEFDRKHPVYKAIVWGPITTSAIVRKLLTSIDQSLIGRQGYLLGITNPVIYGKSIRKAFPSNPFKALSIFTTEQDLFDVEAELDADTNWVRMEKIGKLAITGVHGGMSREEQNIGVPEWVNKIPGVGGSERAGSAFINTLRRLVFRSLVDKLSKTMDGKGKKISNADLRVIANLVNVSTGRGDINIKGVSQILTASSALFFSPRWWLSRLQWWTGQPIWHNSGWWGEGASTEVRQLVAIEMGKQVMAQGMIIGLVSAALAAAFGAPGDDEEWDFYWNPTHAKFGQMRVSNEYFDMTAGLGAHLSYFARVISGQHNDRWEEKETDKWRLSESYGRGKLAPIPSMYADYLAGSSMGGQKFGSVDWWLSKLLPLSSQDVTKAFKNEDIPLASAASVLMFFGVGAQSRDEEMKARKDAINEVRAAQKQNKPQAEILELMNRHFAEQAAIEAKDELRTAEPEQKAALEKVIAGTESPELDAAIEKEKGDLALIASVMLSTEDKTKGKSANDDKTIETARSLLKTIAPTYDEANAIYTDGYKRRNGSITEIVGSGSNKRFALKKSVIQARRRLKMLYSE